MGSSASKDDDIQSKVATKQAIKGRGRRKSDTRPQPRNRRTSFTMADSDSPATSFISPDDSPLENLSPLQTSPIDMPQLLVEDKSPDIQKTDTTQLESPLSEKKPPIKSSSSSSQPLDEYLDQIIGVSRSNNAGPKTFGLEPLLVIKLCQTARNTLLGQPTLLRINTSVKIVGDTHGQYTDLLRIFNKCGHPPDSTYLFLGDYVDRGRQSLENILLLLAYKIRYPDKIYLLRGNHECSNVNRVYGFYDECKRRSNMKVWKAFTDVFNCLPIAAIVQEKIFCVHGGLSPYLDSMEDISSVRRPTEIPEDGCLNDLLWSDPSSNVDLWDENDRGVSVIFGNKALERFLQKHSLELVARGHMVVEDGYEFFGDRNLVTIFSAPNYCGEFDNDAAVMVVNEGPVCSFEIIPAQRQ
eukprot:Partr_v1_DN25459_c0_g1_i1_m53512 putative serine threonine-protein phosphatase